MVHDLSREYDLKADEVLKPVLPEDKPLPVTTSFFYSPSTTNKSPSDRFTRSVQIPVKPKDTVINFYDDTWVETSLYNQQERRNKFKMQRLEMSGMFIRPFAFPKLASNQVVPLLTENTSLTSSTSSSSSTYSSTSSSSSSSANDEESKADRILCTILTNADSLLILALTFILWYWMVAFDMWLPIMVVDVMEMSITELNGIVFGFGCISAVILGIMSLKSFSDRMLYNLSIVCMIALALMELIFIYMRFRHSQMYVNIVLWIIWGTLFAIVVIMDEVFLVGVMAKMTSSKVQTFSESLRLSMSRFGALLALLTSAALFEWIEYVCGVGVIVSLLTLVILVMRRKTLRAPVICIK